MKVIPRQLQYLAVSLGLTGLATFISIGREEADRLRDNEERFRAIFDYAGVGMFEMRSDDRVIAVNERVCRMLGYTPQELVGMRIHDLTAAEDRSESDRLNWELHAGVRDRIEYEKRYIRRDGSPLWVHVTVSGIKDGLGTWQKSIATIADISERKAAEQELQQTTALLTALTETTPDFLFAKDREGRRLWANPAVVRALGKPDEEVVGHVDTDFAADGREAQTIMENDQKVMESGETLSRWSMAPTTAVDIPDSLARIHQAAAEGRRFQIVMVDAQMSGFDGFTLAEWLKNQPHLAGPVILMLDAAEGEVQQRRCVDTSALWLEDAASDSDLLAVITEALQAGERKGGQPGAGDQDSAAHRPLRVLLAEDAPANQKLVVHVLSHRGHSVQVAHNGQQAVEMVEKGHFDAVLMDVQMPIMDGFQATRKMRQMRGRKAKVPIIAMTAHALKGDAERCLAAGMGRRAAWTALPSRSGSWSRKL